ncbi:uncharacterized protein [Pagrus major]|uniref:uncharacterized protein n=1 Tax=Pagrus major TaxID=143350 RepID=UPI003CC8E161
MANHITDLGVSLDEADEKSLQSRGFKKVNVDLNKGARGNYIYIWYRRQSGRAPVTKIQFTFNNEMARGLDRAGYTKIDKNLNAGAKGDYKYLWYYRGSGEFNTPIVDVDVTTVAESEARMLRNGWERLTCDLNRGAKGNWIHVWVKREHQTYICDVTATDSYGSDEQKLRDGYIRMDEDTNRGANGNYVFIWYRQTTDPQRALTDLQVSTNGSERQVLAQQNYQPVNVDLNEGTDGSAVYLWHKKGESNNPMKAITLLLNSEAIEEYEKAGFNLIRRNLNTGNKGWTEYLCYYQ